jgi:hypothetical protein
VNARILYFAAAYRQNKHQPYLEITKSAFQYILNHFMDQMVGLLER